jgi:hypothetical protein
MRLEAAQPLGCCSPGGGGGEGDSAATIISPKSRRLLQKAQGLEVLVKGMFSRVDTETGPVGTIKAPSCCAAAVAVFNIYNLFNQPPRVHKIGYAAVLW